MTDHQRKQIEIINQIEEQVNSNSVKFSLVSSVKNYEDDTRICLTSVHIPHASLIDKVQDSLIKPLKQIEPNYYYYPEDSLHMTIKNIRVINDPPHFTNEDILKAEKVFSDVIPKHKKFNSYFYRLLLFPNNLALIGTTDPELDEIFLDLDKELNKESVSDDKKYSNPKYYFSNMTLARFSKASDKFKSKVQQLFPALSFKPYLVDSVSLLICNAVFKKRRFINTWRLQ